MSFQKQRIDPVYFDAVLRLHTNVAPLPLIGFLSGLN